MRVLIAGWQGQIAQAMEELAFGRPEISALAVSRTALDLCSIPSIRRALFDITPDIVINTAAYTDVDNAEREPDLAFNLNTAGAEAFALEAARIGIPVIQLSTDYVFDGLKVGAYTEEDLPAPGTVYGRSKLRGETAVAQANPKHVIMRTAWVYSSGGRNFVTNMIERAHKHAEVGVVDDQNGSPTYARHLADMILSVAANIVLDGVEDCWGTYHAAGSGYASWNEVAKEVFAASRELGGPAAQVKAIKSADYPTAAARPKNSKLDCTKLERKFGLKMPAWREGVADCVKRLLSAK